jgi:hypothetical protein
MKITKDILRQIITEEISHYLAEETEQVQKDRAIQQVSGILSHLANTNINAQDVINKAKEQFEKNKTAGLDPTDEMEKEDAIDEGCGDGHSMGISIKPGNRKEKKWSDADHDK